MRGHRMNVGLGSGEFGDEPLGPMRAGEAHEGDDPAIGRTDGGVVACGGKAPYPPAPFPASGERGAMRELLRSSQPLEGNHLEGFEVYPLSTVKRAMLAMRVFMPAFSKRTLISSSSPLRRVAMITPSPNLS